MRERLHGIATENSIEADDLGLPHGRIGRGLKNNLAGVLVARGRKKLASTAQILTSVGGFFKCWVGVC